VTRSVRFTPPGRAQFLAALAYIRADRALAARNFRTHVNDSLAHLIDFLDSGRMIPEFPHLRFRELIVVPYHFFYRAEGDTVWIVAVWHEAQLPHEPMERSDG